MALIHSLESSGNWLFKYRGQLPIVLFLLAIPFIFYTDYSWLNKIWGEGLTLVAITLSVSGQIVRATVVGTTPKGTSGRNTKQQLADTLNTTGTYSLCRHPLYLGNYLMWIGIVVYTFNIYFVFIVSLAYWLYYERIMFAEERYLERKFGEEYLNWAKTIPAFIPSLKGYEKSPISFTLKTVLRKEYPGVFAAVVGFIFVDVIRDYFQMPIFHWNHNYTIILAVTGVVVVTLRSLKRYTQVLDEDDRS